MPSRFLSPDATAAERRAAAGELDIDYVQIAPPRVAVAYDPIVMAMLRTDWPILYQNEDDAVLHVPRQSDRDPFEPAWLEGSAAMCDRRHTGRHR